MRNKNLIKLIGAAAIALVLTGPSSAATFRYAIGIPSGVPVESAKSYADKVHQYTNKKHKIKIYELSLLNLSEMSEGVGKGLTDIGWLLTTYNPSDYPFVNIGADLSISTALDKEIKNKESYIYAGVMLDYLLLNCPECLTEFDKNNQVFTGATVSSSYELVCNQQLSSIEQLQGKRVRIANASWARWAREFGAQPVVLPGGELYEALGQGVVDCTLLSLPEIDNFKLFEVVKSITVGVPGGLFSGGAPVTFNKNRWQKLDEADRAAFLKAGAYMTALIAFGYQKQADNVIEMAKDQGITINEASTDLINKSHEFIREEISYLPQAYAKDHRVDLEKNKELAQTIASLTEKWKKIILNSDIESPEDLYQLYWNEVSSKIDPTTYGL